MQVATAQMALMWGVSVLAVHRVADRIFFFKIYRYFFLKSEVRQRGYQDAIVSKLAESLSRSGRLKVGRRLED